MSDELIRDDHFHMMDLSQYDNSQFSRGRAGWFILLWWIVQSTLFRWSLHNANDFRNMLLRAFGAKIGKGVKIRPDAQFYFPWRVEIGDHCWVGSESRFYSLDKITIGANCVISQGVFLNTGSHDFTAPHFNLIIKPVKIEDGAWVAARSFVNLGVTIHENAVIGAMSNVTRDMPANMVCAGNPCQPIKPRIIIACK